VGGITSVESFPTDVSGITSVENSPTDVGGIRLLGQGIADGLTKN